MTKPLNLFFDHRRHKLQVQGLKAPVDVLAFTGKEALSQVFTYSIEFTSSERDIAAEQLLGKRASFSLHGLPPKAMPTAITITASCIQPSWKNPASPRSKQNEPG